MDLRVPHQKMIILRQRRYQPSKLTSSHYEGLHLRNTLLLPASPCNLIYIEPGAHSLIIRQIKLRQMVGPVLPPFQRVDPSPAHNHLLPSPVYLRRKYPHQLTKFRLHVIVSVCHFTKSPTASSYESRASITGESLGKPSIRTSSLNLQGKSKI